MGNEALDGLWYASGVSSVSSDCGQPVKHVTLE